MASVKSPLNEAAMKAAGDALQGALIDLIDLALVAKQAHWNLTGRNFKVVHEHLDEVVALARGGQDDVAERAVAIGRAPTAASARSPTARRSRSWRPAASPTTRSSPRSPTSSRRSSPGSGSASRRPTSRTRSPRTCSSASPPSSRSSTGCSRRRPEPRREPRPGEGRGFSRSAAFRPAICRSWGMRPLSRALPLTAALLALAACGGEAGGADRPCTLIGSEPGLNLIVPDGSRLAAASLRACWGGKCQEPRIRLNPTSKSVSTGCDGTDPTPPAAPPRPRTGARRASRGSTGCPRRPSRSRSSCATRRAGPT